VNILKEGSMFKKSLHLGSVTLVLSALLALAGCPNPATDGPAGAPGRESLSGTIDAARLKELFAVNDTVQLLTGSTLVQGEVPPGKTLEISGSVQLGGGLEVNGVLDIKAGGELGKGSGKLYLGRGGRVLVNGFVYLEQELFLEQPIPSELDSGEVRFDPRVSLGAAGGLSLPGTVVPVGVNNYFTKVNNLKWAHTAPLTAATLPVLSNWVPGKTLTLNAAAITASTDIDVSGKGTLIIDGTVLVPANLSLGAFTLTANAGTRNVIVGENGSITLSDAASALAGGIKIQGALVAGVTAPAVTIPGTVDLTAATLRAGVNNGVFYFADAPYAIGTVDVSPNNLVLRESRGLSIRAVTNTGAGGGTSLTIPPAVTTTIEEVLTNGSNPLTITSISGVQNAILKPGYVAGAAGLILGDNLSLAALDNSYITVASNSKITATTLDDLGSNHTARSEVLGRIRGGSLNLTGNPEIVQAAVINTALIATGALTIAADTTFKVNPTLGAITINDGKNLILDAEVGIARGGNLILTEGVYQGQGGTTGVTISAAGVITAPAATDAGLKIGASAASIGDGNYISLTSNAGGMATFISAKSAPANAPVVFGKAGITIPGDTAGAAKFTVSGTLVGKITVAGTGINITLGPDAKAGVLSLMEHAILAAGDVLTADDGTSPPAAGDYSAGSGTLAAAQNSGSNGINITARTAADGAVITSATKTTN
jgi:hypothetical protein